MVTSINGRLAKTAFRRKVFQRVVAAKLKSELVTNSPILSQFSRTDLAAAVPALAAVFKKQSGRLLFCQVLAGLVMPGGACHAAAAFFFAAARRAFRLHSMAFMTS